MRCGGCGRLTGRGYSPGGSVCRFSPETLSRRYSPQCHLACAQAIRPTTLCLRVVPITRASGKKTVVLFSSSVTSPHWQSLRQYDCLPPGIRDFPLAPMGTPCWRGRVPRCIAATLAVSDAALYPAAIATFGSCTRGRGDEPPPMRGRVNEDLWRTSERIGETVCARASLASRTMHDHFDGGQHAG
jgi:hypothetical protein